MKHPLGNRYSGLAFGRDVNRWPLILTQFCCESKGSIGYLRYDRLKENCIINYTGSKIDVRKATFIRIFLKCISIPSKHFLYGLYTLQHFKDIQKEQKICLKKIFNFLAFFFNFKQVLLSNIVTMWIKGVERGYLANLIHFCLLSGQYYAFNLKDF